jgi:DNA-binding NtrC family response regulator
VRQLKNITEQLSVIEEQRVVTADVIKKYLPDYYPNKLPALYRNDMVDEKTFASEREILYKILFDMKSDLNNLKKLVHGIIDSGENMGDLKNAERLIQNIDQSSSSILNTPTPERSQPEINHLEDDTGIEDTEEYVEESLSLEEKEIELIKKALDKHNGKRKYAAQDLGISERTLYRKIKEYDID